jgi:hypothetical protein
MTKHRQSIQETVTVVPADDSIVESRKDLTACLAEVVKLDGVLGYILKDDATAKIDLRDPEKTVEYALLASEAFDAANKTQLVFGLGDIQDVVVELGRLKMLYVVENDVSVSVFLEKTGDRNLVLAKLRRNQVV